MRRITTIFVIAAGTMLFNLAVGEACGDKMLRMGRGARFQQSLHPANVLIYLPTDASPEASSKAPKLQAFLKKAGHRANIIHGSDRLSEVLSSDHYDVVLTSLAEAGDVEKQIQSSALKPVIVPMILNASKADVTAAKKQYRCMIKNPNNGDEYLDAIDSAMKSRVRVVNKKG